MCHERDTPSVADANDNRFGRSYSRPMTARRREQKMKRTAVILGAAAAFGVAPAIAAGAHEPQVESQIVRSQVVRSQVVRQVVRPGVVRSAVVRQGLAPQRVVSLRRAGVVRLLR
jgi:hypothetical protein